MSNDPRRNPSDGIAVEVQRFDGIAAVVIEFDFARHGGTISTRNAPALVGAAAQAEQDRMPLVSFVASGGVRVQEGMSSLVRLTEVAEAFLRLRRARVPHLLVIRGPIAGGAWALFAGTADVVLAHRGAQIGFAGSRVRPDRADPAAYTAEAKLECGEVDWLIDPGEESSTVLRYLRILTEVVYEEPARARAAVPVPAMPAVVPTPPGPPVPPAKGCAGAGWDAVRRARDPARPRAESYLDAYFDDRVALSGDRSGHRDPGMITGIGLHDGRPIVYLAQAGTATEASGFRTATRVARLAQRWGVGVLTLIDTPGARNDDIAEQGAIGTAIGELLTTLSDLTVPVTSLLIGEGTSGGALALATAGHTWAVPQSYFAVIAPDAAATLLYRDHDRIADAADAIRLWPVALRDDGIIRGIVGEIGGFHP